MKPVLGIALLLSIVFSSCNKPAEACIEIDQSSISVGTTVTFNSCSKHALSYIWSIEGPAGAPENDIQWSESTFSQAFSVSGTYSVELKAYAKYSWVGQPSIATATLTVN